MSQHGHRNSELNDDSTTTHVLPDLTFHPQPTTPPTSPSQGFTSYDTQSPEKADPHARAPIIAIEPPVKPWTPIPLRRWFAISLLSSMLVFAAAIQISLHFSQKQNGWRVPSVFTATTGIMHYVYTLPPVAIAMTLVALWAWTDLDIKRLQPYVDLANGNALAATTLLLDYSNQHAAIVSVYAYRHSHYLVALSSLMVLVGLAVQPLAASFFTVKDTWWNAPRINVTSFEAPGLNPDFGNLSTFSSAAGFVQASALYNVTPPNFVNAVWAIAALHVPRDQVANGTLFANTSSVRSQAHCVPADSGTLSPSSTVALTLTGTLAAAGCTATFAIAGNATLAYGVDVAACGTPPDAAHSPVAFWAYTRAAHAVVFCTPTLEVLDVTVEVALQTGDVQNAEVIGNYSGDNGIAALTDNAGRPLNGVGFNLSGADAFSVERADAARTALAGAVVSLAQQAPGGLSGQIQTQGLVGITAGVYELYLSLVAKENYFVPSTGALDVAIKTVQPRLFILAPTSHILTGVLVAFFLVGTLIHVLHHRTRELIVLPHLPGTLASAAAFTARSNIGDVLDGQLDAEALGRALRDKRFGLDKRTRRIVMDGGA